MIKINREELEWERHPDHLNEVYRHVLWKNEKTGAKIVLIRIEKGELIEQPAHSHPHANQYTIQLSGLVQLPDGNEVSYGEGDYGFQFYPLNEKHAGIKIKGAKVIEERVNLEIFDGPDDWVIDE